jgi:hypothetical protein
MRKGSRKAKAAAKKGVRKRRMGVRKAGRASARKRRK